VDVDCRAFLSDGWGRCSHRQAIYSQNREGYEVELCGRGGGGSEVWLHARVLCKCGAGCEVLVEHGAGRGEYEDK